MKFKKVISILCSGILGLNMCTNFCANKTQAFKFHKGQDNGVGDKLTIDTDIAIVFVYDSNESENSIAEFLKFMQILYSYWNTILDTKCTHSIDCHFVGHTALSNLGNIKNLEEFCATSKIATISLTNEFGIISKDLMDSLKKVGCDSYNLPLLLPGSIRPWKQDLLTTSKAIFLNAENWDIGKAIDEKWLDFTLSDKQESDHIPLSPIKVADNRSK